MMTKALFAVLLVGFAACSDRSAPDDPASLQLLGPGSRSMDGVPMAMVRNPGLRIQPRNLTVLPKRRASSVDALTESFDNPLSGWKSRFMGVHSNLRNYYVTYNQCWSGEPVAEDCRGNNPDGLWLADDNNDDARNARIRFDAAFAAGVTSIDLDLASHTGARIKIYDKDMNVLLDEAVPFGNATSNPGVYSHHSATSTNGVAGFDVLSDAEWGQVEGNVGIDNITLNATEVEVAPPSAPAITEITAADQQLTILFTPPESDGGAEITNYEYSTDGGDDWTALEPAQTTSPIIILGLENGTTYRVAIRAVNEAGAGEASNVVPGTPESQKTEVVQPDEEEEVVVHDEEGNEEAGVLIPAGTFDQATTVTVTLTDPEEEGVPCHAYLLHQTGKCLSITAESSPGVEAELNNDVTVGICLAVPAEVDLFHFETAIGPVKALQEVEFLDCGEPQQGASRVPGNWLEGLALAVANKVGGWMSPKLAYAADRGFGGTVSKDDGFSSFTWADPIDVHEASLIVNPSRNVFTVSGQFDLAATGVIPEFASETGFDPALHAVSVTFGDATFTIPAGSVKKGNGNKWVYARQVDAGVSVLQLDPSDGSFTVHGIVPSGSPVGNRQFAVQIGHRLQATLLLCGNNRRCVPQHTHSH